MGTVTTLVLVAEMEGEGHVRAQKPCGLPKQQNPLYQPILGTLCSAQGPCGRSPLNPSPKPSRQERPLSPCCFIRR